MNARSFVTIASFALCGIAALPAAAFASLQASEDRVVAQETGTVAMRTASADTGKATGRGVKERATRARVMTARVMTAVPRLLERAMTAVPTPPERAMTGVPAQGMAISNLL